MDDTYQCLDKELVSKRNVKIRQNIFIIGEQPIRKLAVG